MIVLRTLHGATDVSLYLPTDLAAAGGGDLPPAQASYVGTRMYSSAGSREFYIEVDQAVIRAQPARRQHVLVVRGLEYNAIFELQVLTPHSRVLLKQSQVSALRAIYDSCCSAAAGAAVEAEQPWCSKYLPAALRPDRLYTDDICHIAPNACDGAGNLISLAMPSGGLRCSALPAASLSALATLTSLDLSNNQLTMSLTVREKDR